VAQTLSDSLSYPEHAESDRISEAATQILGEFESDAFNQAAALAMNGKGDFPQIEASEIQKELARDNVSLDPNDRPFAMHFESNRRSC
jgi:hypothetical protein